MDQEKEQKVNYHPKKLTICKNCGKDEHRKTAVFCSNCGRKLEG
ncbi:hypothetical protein [Enterococcus avium]|uniref:Zinc-ribbon domain-containing protein n=1 Tax=Enterococcus avium TaxID=33945 RepID=A0ABD5FF27_ENTAV|nr:hypothetical protein [Enterococcus avium]MDT2485184.1 hypothetical protein [Enterococcus avium]MDT2511745.1 hypothetical protein [Enterococcus avium]MDT2516825.1 hypothetical protein [Enterococcus avium]